MQSGNKIASNPRRIVFPFHGPFLLSAYNQSGTWLGREYRTEAGRARVDISNHDRTINSLDPLVCLLLCFRRKWRFGQDIN